MNIRLITITFLPGIGNRLVEVTKIVVRRGGIYTERYLENAVLAGEFNIR